MFLLSHNVIEVYDHNFVGKKQHNNLSIFLKYERFA